MLPEKFVIDNGPIELAERFQPPEFIGFDTILEIDPRPEEYNAVDFSSAKLAYDGYIKTMANGGRLMTANAVFSRHRSGVPSPASFGAKHLLKGLI